MPVDTRKFAVLRTIVTRMVAPRPRSLRPERRGRRSRSPDGAQRNLGPYARLPVPGMVPAAYLVRSLLRRDSASTTSAYFVVREPMSA